ncbi:MAG: hypothetical protein IT328_04505 [Caldilineaceae bacterium]|nr:hypothetical protein [Caldilineaceae bacterium]
MDSLISWVPAILGLLALIVAFVFVVANRGNNAPIDLGAALDLAEDGLEYVEDEGVRFIQTIIPAAKEFVKGARQFYISGELELDQLKPKVMEEMKSMFPDVDEKQLEFAVEAAVFGVKLVAKEAWHRLPQGGEEGEIVPPVPYLAAYIRDQGGQDKGSWK